MPLFCKQCNERRLPIVQSEEKTVLWLCDKCGNYVDADDIIIRELTDTERQQRDEKLADFKNNVLTGEKLNRRKGVK